jgi:hypothetical protein
MGDAPKVDAVLVYAPAQNAFYTNFARRLYLACREAGATVGLVSSDLVQKIPPDTVRSSIAILVNPRDLVHGLSDKRPFYETVDCFRNRMMVLAEAVETRWFSQQFDLPISIDSIVDVGFVSQASKMQQYGFDVPYRFLFNGLLKREREKLAARAAAQSSERSIPWAFVGHKTYERVEFARFLIETVDAEGAVFLPEQGHGVRPGSGAISPMGMDLLLKKSRYYVWMAHHEFAYYESFRYREAVLNGAVPLKLEPTFYSEHASVPGVVPNKEELATLMKNGSYAQSYKASAAYYLDHRGLEEGLKEVLFSDI